MVIIPVQSPQADEFIYRPHLLSPIIVPEKDRANLPTARMHTQGVPTHHCFAFLS